jgi:type I restriction enzyme R subunit
MKSLNFEILSKRWPELATLGGLAEAYAHADARSALFNLRLFAENLTKDVYRDLSLPKPFQATFIDLLKNEPFVAITPKVILDKLHAIRMHGNKAAHGEVVQSVTALWLLEEAYDLSRWLLVHFESADPKSLASFVPPPAAEGAEKAGSSNRPSADLLEKLAAQEAQLGLLLEELEVARQKSAVVERTIADLGTIGASAKSSVDLLAFDEATTRTRLIDSMLASAGWNIAPGNSSTASVSKELELSGQPTTSGKGFADYVLWDDDGSPLGVIEAKRTSIDPERGRKQAKLYADAIEAQYHQRPVIFYTNGYDIWLWDDAAGYPPRKLFGYYSKDSLQYLVKFQRAKQTRLADLSPRDDIVERLYQLEAIKRVTERFEQKHRKALIVQATGTGKTRVAIALSELLIRAGWAKRVLFLCDRRELRKQAKNAFTEFLSSEPIKVVNSRVSGAANERIFVATYPAMAKVFESFDVGFFDLIIADESHRSIYNVYGDLFRYFDALQIGLTATPVGFVTRNTFSLFNCEDLNPTSNYDLEQGVEEGYLSPFEVFEHTTQFLRDGIKLAGLTKEQIAQLEEQGEDPAQLEFNAEQIDKAIYNKDTNRAILRNLMEHGLRDASGQHVGKTIIFARNHDHADLIGRLFDEMYPQYGGRFCQVIDHHNPRAEQLIDDFKGAGDNHDLTIAISVDMLDTGIDVPEIINLVFAKPVRSPVKFWQMVGRGTRLCKNLFGPGQHKSVFRIFDHWGNFERFELGYQPAEPKSSKSLLQLLFEERLTLAETALRKSEVAIFERVIKLVEADIRDLPENSVSVREKWKEVHAALQQGRLTQFSPTTVALLRTTIAPLMQWRNIRGFSEAHAFDLLIARIQTAALMGSASVADHKIEFFERVDRLQMHLNPVRERADVIKLAKSEAFWNDVSAAKLEDVREPLRQIIHFWSKKANDGIPPKVIDVSEDPDSIFMERRSTSLKSVDMKAYQQLVEAELRKHFETNAVLRKVRAGEAVTPEELQSLVSLILTQHPDVKQSDLEDFFQSTALPLHITIRAIVGLDPDAVKAKFSDFALKHPALTAKQTRFLALLQNHITKFGFITVDRLYDQPFTVVDADGPEGIFDRSEDVDDLMKIVNLFGPLHLGDAGTTKDDRTKH